MNKSRVLILTIALTAGGAAAWITVSMRPVNTVVQQVQSAPQPRTQNVLVASGELAAGHALTKDDMRWQPWPESMTNSSYIVQSSRPAAVENLTGAVLRSRITSGEPILNKKLLPQNSGFLSSMLPPGKRAVALRVSAESTAGGFILPNDRVDVIHTVDTQSEGRNEQFSRTILKNIRVLAIDQTVDEPTPNDKNEKVKNKTSTVGKTATLELDPGQAEIIAQAEAKGKISLALRSAADNAEDSSVIPTNERPRVQMVRIIRAGRAEIVRVQ
jgi:pilus assembly protein CpaB